MSRRQRSMPLTSAKLDGYEFVSASEASRYAGLRSFAGQVMTCTPDSAGRSLVCEWGEGDGPKRIQTFRLANSAARRRGVGWKPRTPEKTVQAQVVHLIRSVGGSVYVIGTKRPAKDFQGTCQTPGLPDIYAFLPKPRLQAVPDGQARCVWVEVKAEGGKLRTEQEKFRDWCHLAGVSHVVGGVTEVTSFLVMGGWLKRENVAHYRRVGEG